MTIPRPRQIVFEALKVAAPSAFTKELQSSFLADGLNLKLADLEMDSLGQMEFCIAIELACGVSVVPSQLAELASTNAVELRIREALG